MAPHAANAAQNGSGSPEKAVSSALGRLATRYRSATRSTRTLCLGGAGRPGKLWELDPPPPVDGLRTSVEANVPVNGPATKLRLTRRS